MMELRFLELPMGDRRISRHPSGTFIDRGSHSVWRVTQTREVWLASERATHWRDVPTVSDEAA